MKPPTSQSIPLIFRAGTAATRVTAAGGRLLLDCPMPWLAGPESQVLALGAALAASDDGWLLQGADVLAGVLVARGDAALEEESFQLYQRMFATTRRLNLYRIWNYVPRINAMVAGVENYLAFNSGRHRAFMEQFGGIAAQDLSAASAVGTQGGTLAVAFVAGRDPVNHYENPLQTPSASYPERYGKNSPLFARGSRIRAADGATCWHLSGTASIRGSETIRGDFAHQLEITLENIARILSEMEVPAVRQAAWKVFLRYPWNLEACRRRLAQVYPGELAQMMFLEADICRGDLLLEIEGMFQQAPPVA